MKEKKYSIGVDFGTQSGRALLVDVETGEEIAVSVAPYKHGVMDEYLPDGTTKLEIGWALQHPGDYLEVLKTTIPDVLKKSKVNAEDVIGLGVDFTSCTMLPIDGEGLPLCFNEEYKSNPHSYVKLWKHNSSQEEADLLNKIAEERGEEFFHRFGGKISAESLIPKVWQILNESPEIYEAADRFIEAGDWIVLMLTGKEKRSSCMAGYKALWDKEKGYPSRGFLKALDPRLENLVEDKLGKEILSPGKMAGEITHESSKYTGLKPGTPVSVATIDAHVTMAGVGVVDQGKMLMIMGTSTCHMVMDNERKVVAGISGVVMDGLIEGYWGYEAGQPCVGDLFDWFSNNCLPPSYLEEADNRDINILALLKEKSAKLKPGENGLIALDWWNGNRSILLDSELSGLIIGCTLTTKPEEIYRALMEATAFGTRVIIENYRESGILINELYAAGGIAEKDELMMQIYADVTNMEIKISNSPQAPALGSAMYGAVAAGRERGGYNNIFEASKAMAKIKEKSFKPIAENVKVYEQLYEEYKKLHDYFGHGKNDIMKKLINIKKDTRS